MLQFATGPKLFVLYCQARNENNRISHRYATIFFHSFFSRRDIVSKLWYTDLSPWYRVFVCVALWVGVGVDVGVLPLWSFDTVL